MIGPHLLLPYSPQPLPMPPPSDNPLSPISDIFTREWGHPLKHWKPPNGHTLQLLHSSFLLILYFGQGVWVEHVHKCTKACNYLRFHIWTKIQLIDNHCSLYCGILLTC